RHLFGRGLWRMMRVVPEQPSGTVTLVFTDIEGSTRLLHELGQDAYREALAEHRHVVREAFSNRYEVDYEGDAFFYAFRAAGGAGGGCVGGKGGVEGGADTDPRWCSHGGAGPRPAEVRGDGCASGGADHGRRARRSGGGVAVDPGSARRR